jgi:hypothetical protein
MNYSNSIKDDIKNSCMYSNNIYNNYIDSCDENAYLLNKIDIMNSYIQKLEKHNKTLLNQLKNKNKIISEYESENIRLNYENDLLEDRFKIEKNDIINYKNICNESIKKYHEIKRNNSELNQKNINLYADLIALKMTKYDLTTPQQLDELENGYLERKKLVELIEKKDYEISELKEEIHNLQFKPELIVNSSNFINNIDNNCNDTIYLNTQTDESHIYDNDDDKDLLSLIALDETRYDSD